MRESLTWNRPKQTEEESLEEKEKIYEMTRGGEADRNGDRIWKDKGSLEGCHRRIRSTVDAIKFRGEISERRESIELGKERKEEITKG